MPRDPDVKNDARGAFCLLSRHDRKYAFHKQWFQNCNEGVAEKVALWLQAFCLLRPRSLWRWAGSFVWLSFRLGFRVSQNSTTLQVFLSFVEGTCDWKNSYLIVILFGPRIAASSRETRWKPILLAWFSSCGLWHHDLFLDLPPFERLGLLPLLFLAFKGSCPFAMAAVKRRVACLAFLLVAPRS